MATHISMRNIVANKSLIYCLIALVIVVFILIHRSIFSHNDANDSNVKRAVIICQKEDLSNTPFIEKLRANETVVLPEKSALGYLSREDLAMLYHRYVENIQFHCKRLVRLGKLGDGGWDICDDDKYRPRQSDCLVYSFGINNDFSFDDATILEYDCDVHSFDPSMGIDTYQRSKRNFFYNQGIGAGTQEEVKNWKEKSHDNKQGWDIKSLAEIRLSLRHTMKKIDILKMDIELGEWTSLPDMIKTGDLNDVRQLLIEFHLNLLWPPAEEGRDTYLLAVSILKDLYDLGFRIFWTHRNIDGSLIFESKCKRITRANCHELNFVRID